MSWLSLILAVLKVINAFMDWANREKLMQAGYDKAIAETAAAILKKTAAGRAMMEKVNAMSDAEVDDGLRGLEPADNVSTRSGR